MPETINALRRLAKLGHRLAEDTQAAILAMSVVLLIFVLGTGGLVLDFARVWNGQSELHAFTDHAALVAAGELDGNAGAIARANAALAQLITDRQHYANEAVGLTSDSVVVRFLSDLPADDQDNNLAPFLTNDDALARFVHVQTDPYTVSTIFADILLAVSGNDGVDIGIGAVSVAGFTQYVCDITPLMFCTPGPNYEPVPGRQIHLKSTASWQPGAFGLLDVNFDPNGPCGSPNTGANYFRCVLGVTQSVTQCFERRGVDVRPGQMTGAAASGFNTRFDMYQTSLKSESNNPLFAPAPNVTKGYVPKGGNACNNNMDPSPDTVGLPRDTCFTGDTCSTTGSPFGPNPPVWDKNGYLAANHDGVDPGFITGIETSTRYGMYLAELAAAVGPTAPLLPQPRAETGRPICNASPPAGEERRLLIAAAIDCTNNPFNGNASNVPVEMFVELFVTEPAGISGGSDNTSLWVEEVRKIDNAGISGIGVIRDVVQLYR
jgi:hypothetical protein